MKPIYAMPAADRLKVASLSGVASAPRHFQHVRDGVLSEDVAERAVQELREITTDPALLAAECGIKLGAGRARGNARDLLGAELLRRAGAGPEELIEAYAADCEQRLAVSDRPRDQR